ncbi:MAG: DUF1592 domain-containing protein [Planctomycetaceae bacterium]|nr:DUF1592 domain-containing protein [Planctomycetaceae bacterium]
MRRFLPLACLLAFAFAGEWARSDEGAQALKDSFARDVKPFLQQHCVRCHNPDKLTSGIRVDHLDANLEDRQIKLWEAVRHQIEIDAMPPGEEPQPTKAQRDRMLAWIGRGIEVARSRPAPKNGSVRRLTVAQYRNTLRELLLLDDELTETLPPDAVSRDGFTNNQETLALSPLLVEAYFDIAETALKRCLVDPKSKPTIQKFRVDLGAKINKEPCPDRLILGADSLLLNNEDFLVTQLTAEKPFAFEPFVMRTKYRFIEGYQGNDTVRGWREYDSIYHSVFACMRGTHGYPKGRAYSTVPQGLLLRPAIPSAEIFGQESTYGPRANFKISLRELPDDGRFRVTVTAAKYIDGLLLDAGAAPQESEAQARTTAIVVRDFADASTQTIALTKAGVYQFDAYPVQVEAKPGAAREKPQELTLTLGDRSFVGTLNQPAFLAVRLEAGPLNITAQYPGPTKLDRLVLTPLPDDHDIAKRFVLFEKRTPKLGVHLGLRRDCGSTLSQVGTAQTVSSTTPSPFVFEGAIRNFPSPDVEKDNVNYLAGVREIGVRSEFTDGRDLPRLLLRSVEFEGPYYDAWPPATHRNIFLDRDAGEDDATYARRLLERFAAHAFRRPATTAESASLMATFEKSARAGSPFEESIKDALLVVLTSPQFLFLTENSRTPDAEPLDQHELASKLSYFLWNGPPDAALIDLAVKGRLRDSLDEQVVRMIADHRFERFTSEFVTQWLALDKFAVLEPDRGRFPKLTRDTRTQLQREPVAFFQHLVRQNLRAQQLIASDFVLANETTASYYDLADRTESGFDFVAIPHGRRELGGVLSQAALMAGLSDGRESNPVKRGAWLARRIIAEPPDDPPPNVPTVKDDPTLSLRQRLERHRNQPGCAQCHSKIDPWGIPLEEFDAGGRLKSMPADAASTLPDKSQVAGFEGLRKYLADDRIDQVAFSLLKHLTTYATGRTLTYHEQALLKRDVVKLKPDGYRMQDLVRYVVRSPMFLEK